MIAVISGATRINNIYSVSLATYLTIYLFNYNFFIMARTTNKNGDQ
jgi:hypothetical protein